MRVWIVLLLCAMASTAAEAGVCPADAEFSSVFTATLDQIIDAPSTIIPDPELTFFTRYMQFRDEAIQHFTDDAIRYFNQTFGLDFSNSAPNRQNERFFENAKMSPFIVPPDTTNFVVNSNNWIRSGSTRSQCFLVRDGGFQVGFSGVQILGGSYGGIEGKPVGQSDSLYYGFYNIDVCPQSPVIIQYQSGGPVRAVAVDGHFVVDSDLYSTVLGRGKAIGVATTNQLSEDPKLYRVRFRLAFTFPLTL